MSRRHRRTTRAKHGRSCAFCGYAVAASVTPVVSRGRTFCSTACCEAFADGDPPFADALGFKRYPTGVEALGAGLPQGVPGNAAVLFAGEEGTRLQGLLQECVWRALERGEPAVVVSMDRPPCSLVDSFLDHGWNVLPHLEASNLLVVDLFTGRLQDEPSISDPDLRWNGHLQSVLDGAVRRVRNPSDVLETANKLDSALEDLGMTATGVVAVDLLGELAAVAQETRAANLLREARALVCKRRYVPLFAGASVGRREDRYPTDFPHDHEYLFDGIVDLVLEDDRDTDGRDGNRTTRLSARKMDDAPTVSGWVDYEHRPGAGFVPSSADERATQQPE